MGWTIHHPPHASGKKKWCILCSFPESGHYSGQKNRVFFLAKNLFLIYFWPKTPRKHLRDSFKRIHNHKKHKKNNHKIPKSTQNKKQFLISYTIFRCFQGKKKYIILTPIIIWNHLTQKTNCFNGWIPHQ
jgi:hypothetical protein